MCNINIGLKTTDLKDIQPTNLQTWRLDRTREPSQKSYWEPRKQVQMGGLAHGQQLSEGMFPSRGATNIWYWQVSKLAGTVRHLWLRILIWSIPGPIYPCWHIFLIKYKLDRFFSAVFLHRHGSSCRKAFGQGLLQTSCITRVYHLCFLVRCVLSSQQNGNVTWPPLF